MTNELKKQSKQIEIETKSTNLVANNEINEDLVDANTIANRLNTTIDNVIHKIQSLNIQPKTYIMKGAKKNVKTALYSWEEIKQQQQQVALAKLDTKTDKMNNQYSFDELKIAFGKSLENQSSKEIGNLGLQLIAIAMNKQQETKHKIDVLKAKITKAVRTKAYQNHWTYKETYVRYYKLYDEAHNFPYKEDYNGYINTVEKRGHLLELYNIIVNDF